MFNGMSNLQKLTLNGTWNNLNANALTNCYLLKELHLPRVFSSAASGNLINNTLKALQIIHVPDYINDSAAGYSKYATVGTGTETNVVKKVYGDFEFASGEAAFTFNSGYYNLFLEELNLPKLKVASIRLGDNGTTYKMKKLGILNLDFSNSTFSSTTAPQIKIAAPLSASWLNAMFTALPTVTTKTIDVRYCDGYAGCDKTIAAAKGWTVL